MLDQEILKAEQAWAQLVVTNAKSILIRNGKVASGRLRDSIEYKVNAQGKISFTYAPEGKWVTLGRRKGSKQPPTAPIERWIKQKSIRGRDPKTGRFISDKSLAYLIARGIKRDGIEPLPFMKLAIDQSIKQLGKSLKTSIAKAEVKKWKAAIKKELKP
jgi:hypothetical protein